MATAHRIASREVDPKETLPASDFTLKIGGKSFDFKFSGGTAEAFARLFERRKDLEKILTFSSVKKSGDRRVLVLASEKTGPNGKIELVADTGNLFQALEFFTPDTKKKEEGTPLFAQADIPYSPQVKTEKDRFVLDPESSLVAPLSNGLSLKDKDTVSFRVEFDSTTVSTPSNLIAGGQGSSTNGGLSTDLDFAFKDRIAIDNDVLDISILRGFDDEKKKQIEDEKRRELERIKNIPPPKNQVVDASFVKIKMAGGAANAASERVFSLPSDFTNKLRGASDVTLSLKELFPGQAPPAEARIEEIRFVNNNTAFRYTITFPKYSPAPKDGGPGLKAPHEVSPPQSALIDYKGVKVEREGNLVSDLIDGVTLDLKKVKDADIHFKVDWNQEAIQNGVINFVAQYNVVMEMLNVGLSADPPPPETKEEAKPRFGLFKNETAFRFLKDKMRAIPPDKHPTSKPEVLVLLSQIGISPIYIPGGASDPNAGKLEFKEEKFKKVFSESPELIPELFAFDTDEDKVPDTGAALDMSRLSRSYAGRGAVLDSQKEADRRRIEALDKDIKHDEQELASYKQKLVKEFSDLTSAQKEFERMSKYMDSTMGK
ncbi:MAG: flagellar filament capping protein FliD [Spirochaetia bacterium]|nr:flagellar filament capping protein FliD [Spirochaetia bacterium]